MEVTATCGHPPELRGLNMRDVHVFTSCPESISPLDKKLTTTPKAPNVNKAKPKASILKAAGVKARPAKTKTQPSKPRTGLRGKTLKHQQ